MNIKFVVAVGIVVTTVVALVIAAVSDTAKAVTTVESLVRSKRDGTNLRLGARVAEGEVKSTAEPSFQVRFLVHGKELPDIKLPVIFHGVMPDTLRPGRDVIVEGDFDGEQFVAYSLLTQCPSKYEPPMPGEESYD